MIVTEIGGSSLKNTQQVALVNMNAGFVDSELAVKKFEVGLIEHCPVAALGWRISICNTKEEGKNRE